MIIGLAVIFPVVVGGGVVLAGFIRRLGDEIQTNTKIARKLWLVCVAAVLPSQVQAQEAPDRREAPDRFVLEAGIAGDSGACPGRYVGINARVAYGGGDEVSPTAGASLTFGRRYGARFILHVSEESGTDLVRFQMGGYVSF